jgi:hypothetical protein
MTKHRRIVGLVTIALIAAAATASGTRSPSRSSVASNDGGSGADVRLREPTLAAASSNDDAKLKGRDHSRRPIRYEAVIANWKRHRESHSGK